MCGQRDDRKAYPECILFLFFSNVSGEHPLFNHQRSLDPSVQIKPPKWHCIHFSISLYSCALYLDLKDKSSRELSHDKYGHYLTHTHTQTHARPRTQTHTHTHTHTHTNTQTHGT